MPSFINTSNRASEAFAAVLCMPFSGLWLSGTRHPSNGPGAQSISCRSRSGSGEVMTLRAVALSIIRRSKCRRTTWWLDFWAYGVGCISSTEDRNASRGVVVANSVFAHLAAIGANLGKGICGRLVRPRRSRAFAQMRRCLTGKYRTLSSQPRVSLLTRGFCCQIIKPIFPPDISAYVCWMTPAIAGVA